MMYIDFEYDNRRLSDFGYVMGYIDTSAGLQEVDIGCDITFTTVKNNHSSIHSVTSSSYDNVFTTTFHILKNSCNSIDDFYMTQMDVREMMRWLNKRGHYKFKPFNTEYDVDIHYYGSFNVKQITLAGKIIGLSLTFTSNTPYSFGNDIELNFISTQENETMYLYGDSDELGIIYPKVKIKCLSDGELKITNQTSGNVLYIDNCVKDEIITIDGEHKIIITDNEDHNKTLSNDFNYEYFDIMVGEYDSENIYEVSMPCEMNIVYSPIRKVGMY